MRYSYLYAVPERKHSQQVIQSESDVNQTVSKPESPHRLPCRGCLPTCKNFDRCEGKPWRVFVPPAPKK
jgi:hypothetical protein